MEKSKSKSLSLDQLFATPWTIEYMEFYRPEYWSGWSFPSPGDPPNPGIEAQGSCIAGRFFTSWPTREAQLPMESKWKRKTLLPPVYSLSLVSTEWDWIT